ncbi:hypothetical protein [Reichenbachiella sp.]|uniref:hypothetical protein n=1 Tax=Reichenbachiella sp. TaxID=2184521 RepID=UPI003BAF54AC
MNTITIPSNSDYEAFFQGQKIADHPKKRAMSMLLAIVAGLLLYSGLKVTPMDEKLTYAGVLTLVYVFLGRNFMFKVKVKNLWGQKKETNPELIVNQKGVEIKHHIPERCKTMAWADFGYYKIEEQVAFLYPKKAPENWLTLSLKEIDGEQKQDLRQLIKENIKITQPQK